MIPCRCNRHIYIYLNSHIYIYFSHIYIYIFDSMICIYVQYENMNPVRAGVGVCVFLGVREI